MSSCTVVDTFNTYWHFCPSIAAAYVLLASFAVSTIGHVIQGFTYRKVYCWVIVASGLAQTIAYIFRVLSIQNPTSLGDYAGWFVLILVAPLLTNAFVYMIMGRMVWNFIDDAQISKVKAWRLGILFVLLDLLAAIIQIYGAAQASTAEKGDIDFVLKNIHIYQAGVGVQQGFILLFLYFAIRFHIVFTRKPKTKERKSVLIMLYVIYAVLILITIRILFRLIEYKDGLDSKVPNQEAYQYCLDSLPMLLALLILNVVHPGMVMPGKRYDMPSRKLRKQQKITCKADVDENCISL